MAGLKDSSVLSQAAQQKTILSGYNPIVDPDDTEYFSDRMGLSRSPANPRAIKAAIEGHRSNGGRADLNRPTIAGSPASYGLRPPIMDPFLPDYEKWQPNSIE